MSYMISFNIPPDQALLAAVGEVALRHEHMTHILKMTIKSLTRVTVEEALDATEFDGARELRERVKKLARRELGEGTPLVQLQALVSRCGRATDKRNSMIHGIWAKELDGEYVQRRPGNTWGPQPTRDELLALAGEIEEITLTLNYARLEGFVAQALAEKAVR